MDVQLAAAVLKAGKLVAFPTETVYGLGADAYNSAACRKVYEVKGRPGDNPLIVHVPDVAGAKACVAGGGGGGGWSVAAQRLAEQFWPGPLTMVLPRHPSISRDATANRETVALRVPDHPLALAMLRAFGGPVAAPSANRSNRVSPTTAEHVRHELGDKVDLILDGGACPVGIESTVVDLTTFPKPTLLRPGHVSLAQIEAVIGPVAFTHRYVSADDSLVKEGSGAPGHASPGLAALHYAPTTPAYRFQREDYPRVIARLGSSGDVEHDEELGPDTGSPALPHGDGAAIVMLLSKAAIPSPHDVMPMPGTPDGYARMLYAGLRSADAGGYRSIYVELPPDTPEWLAVRDRLLRATRPMP